ncbi:hypothetical protein [Streptomyces sp. NPDC006739]|uniref:hypothetical protein n=1 Tax=Streptomyces sp. NPDC006739 TaxID=3364763 RepID=UPI0036BBB34F
MTHTLGPSRARLVLVGDPVADPPAGAPEYGDGDHADHRGAGPGDAEFRQAPRTGPPAALIRLRFADAVALGRARAAFGAGAGRGLGDASSDVATLTLQIRGDAGTETLRSVLTVLDAAAVTAESLTVHTNELDDVFAAFTNLP